MQLGQKDKSALAEHGWRTGNKIMFSNTVRLFHSVSWGKQVIRESHEICLETFALNQVDGLRLSLAWLTVLDLVCLFNQAMCLLINAMGQLSLLRGSGLLSLSLTD